MKKTRNYTVYFEIYGKKMKVRVLAEDEEAAKRKVTEAISFHRIIADKNDIFNQSMDTMDDIIDLLTKKK